MSSDAQELNVVPDSVYIKRNFNQLVRFKLRYYDKEVRDILEGEEISTFLINFILNNRFPMF